MFMETLLPWFFCRTAWYDKTPESETTTSSTLCWQELVKSKKVRSCASVNINSELLLFLLFFNDPIYTFGFMWEVIVKIVWFQLLIINFYLWIHIVCSHYTFALAGLYFLEDPAESYHYLSQSGCLKDKSLNDKELFNSVMVSIDFVFSSSSRCTEVCKNSSLLLSIVFFIQLQK